MALSEQEFLGAIARRLGRAPLAAPPARPGHVRGIVPPPANMAGRAAMADWFTRELNKLTGTVDMAASLDEAGAMAARAMAARAVAGVTSARYAVAETGSVAVSASPGQGRAVSLLPPLHVAIVPTSRMLATVNEYFRAVGALDRMPAALNLITGPSRTADIELELCVGVHGPAALHVVLYRD